MQARRGIWLSAVLGAAVAGASLPAPVAANWLSKVVREAGEAGGKAGAKAGLGALDNAALHLKTLPAGGSGASLAAHAMPEGHWRFVNRSGDVYTAGTPDELKRVVEALAPEAAAASAETRLSLYLSEETIFAQRAMLKELPSEARLHVVIGKDSYPLLRRTEGRTELVFAEVRPNVSVRLGERHLASEALFQLARPLDTSRLRIVALKPGGPDALKPLPGFDASTKGALVDEIDPGSLAKALQSLRGQTAVLTGRIEEGALKFRPASGAERSIPMSEIERAAAAFDVDLVVLQGAVTSQPGGRNWLWQKVEVAGLGDAAKRATFADFLNALGAGRGPFSVEVARSSEGRTVLRALPSGGTSEPITGKLAEWMSEVVSEVTGNLVTSAIEVNAASAERQRELDARLIPGIPSILQIVYLGSIVAGLVGLPLARGWWARVWPRESRAEYASGLGYHAARFAKLLAFVLLFLPAVGPVALAASVTMQLWSLATATWRALKWLGGLVSRRRTPASG